MNEDYTQPFYVPIGKGKRNLHAGQVGGYYLPALEPKEELPEDKPEETWNKRQWGIVNQLRLEQKDIRKLIYKTLKEKKEKDASKGKTKYKYTI